MIISTVDKGCVAIIITIILIFSFPLLCSYVTMLNDKTEHYIYNPISNLNTNYSLPRGCPASPPDDTPSLPGRTSTKAVPNLQCRDNGIAHHILT